MKRLLILLLVLIFTQSIYSQQGKGLSNTVDNAGYCYVTGYTNNPGSGNDLLVLKYDLNGDTLWSRTYSGDDPTADDQGIGIKSTADGFVYVVGNIGYLSTGYDVVILKYSFDGTLIWTQTCGSVNSELEDRAFGIAVDESDNVYITGFSNKYGQTRIFTAKYNSSGYRIWSKFNNGPDHLLSVGSAITFDHYGFVYVTGYTTTYSNGTDIITVKYGPNYGTEYWTRTFNGLANSEDRAFGIAVDDADGIYVTGYQSNDMNSPNTDITLLKYSSGGSLVWAKFYDGGGDDKAFGLVTDGVTALYITGYSSTAALGMNYITLKYDLASGTNLWTTTYDGTGSNDKATSIGLIKDNGVTVGVVITGTSFAPDSTSDYATLSYAVNSGALVDSSKYSLGAGTVNVATQLAVTPTGTVYVTGGSTLVINGRFVAKVRTQQMHWGSNSNKIKNTNVPTSYNLYQNYPNPFNPSTNIKFDLVKSSVVKITIYDMLGKEVEVPVNQTMQPGTHEIRYTNSNLSSGTYFYELKTDNFRDVKKMILVK